MLRIHERHGDNTLAQEGAGCVQGGQKVGRYKSSFHFLSMVDVPKLPCPDEVKLMIEFI